MRIPHQRQFTDIFQTYYCVRKNNMKHVLATAFICL